MKKFLVVAMLLLAIQTHSQCVQVVCTRTLPLTGNTTNGDFDIPGIPNLKTCFRGRGTIGTGANFGSLWGWIYLRDTIVCKKALIMPPGRKILTKDSIQLYSVTMVGSDSIISYGGSLKIDTLVSSNSTAGQRNVIMLPYINSMINYRGAIYHPGDTIALTSNLDSNVLVMSCNSIPLAIDYINLERHGNDLTWQYDDVTYLWYSQDAKSYTLLPGTYFAGESRYTINKGGYYKVKSFDKESKVLPVTYDPEERQKQVIYFYNNNTQISRTRPVGVPVVGTKTLK